MSMHQTTLMVTRRSRTTAGKTGISDGEFTRTRQLVDALADAAQIPLRKGTQQAEIFEVYGEQNFKYVGVEVGIKDSGVGRITFGSDDMRAYVIFGRFFTKTAGTSLEQAFGDASRLAQTALRLAESHGYVGTAKVELGGEFEKQDTVRTFVEVRAEVPKNELMKTAQVIGGLHAVIKDYLASP